MLIWEPVDFLLAGAQVLTIKTQEENDFLVQHIMDDPLITNQVWLDVKYDPQGKKKKNPKVEVQDRYKEPNSFLFPVR